MRKRISFVLTLALLFALIPWQAAFAGTITIAVDTDIVADGNNAGYDDKDGLFFTVQLGDDSDATTIAAVVSHAAISITPSALAEWTDEYVSTAAIKYNIPLASLSAIDLASYYGDEITISATAISSTSVTLPEFTAKLYGPKASLASQTLSAPTYGSYYTTTLAITGGTGQVNVIHDQGTPSAGLSAPSTNGGTFTVSGTPSAVDIGVERALTLKLNDARGTSAAITVTIPAVQKAQLTAAKKTTADIKVDSGGSFPAAKDLINYSGFKFSDTIARLSGEPTLTATRMGSSYPTNSKPADGYYYLTVHFSGVTSDEYILPASVTNIGFQVGGSGTGGGGGGGSTVGSTTETSRHAGGGGSNTSYLLRFTDVPESTWYFNYVNALADRNIVEGVSASEFSPESNITRAQAATIFARMAGVELSVYNGSQFGDVSTAAWYAQAVEWARASGIVTGYASGLFGPDAYITRQDFAVMIDRYSRQIANHNITGVNAVAPFADQAAIGAYAQDAVTNMQQAGIINGFEDGTFAPQKNATRAEACKIISVLLTQLGK
ncbi:MAG: S-layer homology domain-containing protein [Clostridiales Family XIII bacterium]|nr:S-layer homology domain-containing protein [Clostridiales Family XIII bacterium]